MVVYHGLYNLVELFGVEIPWFYGGIGYVWQQFICWTFILLSGFSWPLGNNHLKRGLSILGMGFIITLVTIFFIPEQRVVGGILSFLGLAMIMMIPLHKLLQKIYPLVGFLCMTILFFVFRGINGGYLGFEDFVIVTLPKFIYESALGWILGLPNRQFYSSDYFSIFPWIFLYTMGYFIYYILKEKDVILKVLSSHKFHCRPLEYLGKHSLSIYMLHQPILYGIFYFCNVIGLL